MKENQFFSPLSSALSLGFGAIEEMKDENLTFSPGQCILVFAA